MRRWLRSHLSDHCPRADDIDLVATELATNAVRHTFPQAAWWGVNAAGENRPAWWEHH